MRVGMAQFAGDPLTLWREHPADAVIVDTDVPGFVNFVQCPAERVPAKMHTGPLACLIRGSVGT